MYVCEDLGRKKREADTFRTAEVITWIYILLKVRGWLHLTTTILLVGVGGPITRSLVVGSNA